MEDFIYIQALQLQEQLVHTIDKGIDTNSEIMYESRRQNLLNTQLLKNVIPEWLNSVHSLSHFYQWIKEKGNAQQRKKVIYDSFEPLLRFLQSKPSIIGEVLVNEKLEVYRETYIYEAWKKALDRKESDPEGSITSSRTLLESTCKYILKKLEVDFDKESDLPKLCKLTVSALNIAPDSSSRETFTKIFNGCYTVIAGIGELRNKLSDAHGKTEGQTKPLSRHAEFSVNLSGTLSAYLLETYEDIREK